MTLKIQSDPSPLGYGIFQNGLADFVKMFPEFCRRPSVCQFVSPSVFSLVFFLQLFALMEPPAGVLNEDGFLLEVGALEVHSLPVALLR